MLSRTAGEGADRDRSISPALSPRASEEPSSSAGQRSSKADAARADHHYRLHHDPYSSHQQIARFLRNLNRSPILDIGAAQGMLGQQLQGSGLAIDGVEPNPVWAQAAVPYYGKVHVGTIESVSLPPDRYPVIVCADVLEHTVDPVSVVRRLLTHATPDATFIVSVPNVAHLAVRMMLLFGMFPKMQRGILDKTHFQFLTKETATDLLREGGLKVERTFATGVPLEEIWKSGRPAFLFDAVRNVQRLMVGLLPRLFAFQWIFVARPI